LNGFAGSTSGSVFVLLTINGIVGSNTSIFSYEVSASDTTAPGFTFADIGSGLFETYCNSALATITYGSVPQTVLLATTFNGANNILRSSSPTTTSSAAFSGTIGGSSGSFFLGQDPIRNSANFTLAAAGVTSAYAMTAVDFANLITWANLNFGTSFPGGTSLGPVSGPIGLAASEC
jgi:hypothetical protein